VSGCDPDFDAWGMCENPVIDLEETTTRYAGGHLHFGLDYASSPSKVTAFIKRLDASIGVGMLAIFGVSDRFKTYGRFGAHRPKSYGVEYRSIDNSWLLGKRYMQWIWEASYYMSRMNGVPSIDVDVLNALVADNDLSALRDVYYQNCPIDLPEKHQWN